MKKHRVFLILTLVITTSSCNFFQTNTADKLADTLLAKTVVFPEELLHLKGNLFLGIDSILNSIEGKAKLVSIVDGTCPACIYGQLNNIDSTFNKFNLHDKVQLVYILNVSSSDSAYFMRNFQSYIKATGAVLWDNNFNFERENKLFTPDQSLRTFMVDKDNRIIIYGNPLIEPKLLAAYKEKIEQCH